MNPKYDVIVIGAGHAGSEAASAAANLGSKVLLITMDMTKIAHMSCNPAMGGIAKGQIIRELDALGGYSGIVTDESMIQFRMLNRSKGPAMWSPRAQCDRLKFSRIWREKLESIPNLEFWQDMVVRLLIQNNTVYGVETRLGIPFYAKTVILTTGTFLNGLMHIGSKKISGGRAGESASTGLSEQLLQQGFETGRMKTGTPPRLDGRTIDYSKLQEQPGDKNWKQFSFLPLRDIMKVKKSCYITFTDPNVHKILEKGFDESPMFNGTINSIGPRYCPSIEDKVVTFSDKDAHQLFLEPEGENTVECYLNGFSSSLPWNIQYEGIRSLPGFENVKIFRPGYAIEYDFFSPTQLNYTMETKRITNLFFAGQVNGTTGYEEAGAQGIIAGINAHQKIQDKEEFILNRDQAYIGVLIDDLITKGVDEPYRMFTSRAEYRLLLRQDNADIRLTELSYKLGLASEYRYNMLKEKINHRDHILNFFRNYSTPPEEINPLLQGLNTSQTKQKRKLVDILLRPQVNIYQLIEYVPKLRELYDALPNRRDEIMEAVEIIIKYSGYIDREKQIAGKLNRLEHIRIRDNFNYNQIQSLSIEARQKLNRIRPRTIGQASRISGVSPSDVSVLLMYHGR
ncbi:MAG: tRNA uridine-5-carboxymethylaminomethyl(34) synthesis enzyme MnmG [Bacteroidales bacterium]|nr:tRNA uridine-5-carboxymethylaminomethyl(34) synthesis enzyme MnmG [Bacteroidales bacterium]